MELAQEGEFPVTHAQDEFAQNLKLLPTSPQLWAARQTTLDIEDVKLRHCKPGELCRFTTVSGPDICVRLARITSRVDSFLRSDVYRINDPAMAVKLCQQAAILKYLSSPHTRKPATGDEGGKCDGEGKNRARQP